MLREVFFFLMVENLFDDTTDLVEMQRKEKSCSKYQVWTRRFCWVEERQAVDRRPDSTSVFTGDRVGCMADVGSTCYI